ncbi:DegT/DnrJ/EryC1/StrS aminotransferase family protein, partial [Candidatus Saccharibacteria bacterium]|nr:DegT/DnrJ/EryC1/StrS aminotransferase family protein [Candidatus Saccharibacteria bacterium]
MKFQALGSNYDLRWAMRQLVATGTEKSSKQLVTALEHRYGGHAYLYSKGRNALSQAVQLCRDDTTSRIAINGLTCSVVVDAIRDADAQPMYLDVDPATAHFDIHTLKNAVAKQEDISAVIIQNTYGRMVDIAPIEEFAKQHDILLIEDLAHSIGQKYPDGREAGTVGDLVMLSFGRDKILDVVNGGALIIRSPKLHHAMQPPQQMPSLLTQFRDRIYPALTWKVRTMYNIGLGKIIHLAMYRLRLAVRSADGIISRSERLPHWQASLINERLAQLDETNEHRRGIMAVYQRYFGDSLISKNGTIRAAVAVENRTGALKALRTAGYELDDT